jgi:hypothetical protein
MNEDKKQKLEELFSEYERVYNNGKEIRSKILHSIYLQNKKQYEEYITLKQKVSIAYKRLEE